jgi:hypothetical protein
VAPEFAFSTAELAPGGDVAWLDLARAMKARKAEPQNARTSIPGTS